MTAFGAYIIRVLRRLSVIVAATVIILSYIVLLNFFGRLFGAGQGWDNPLLWFASAMIAFFIVFAAAWILTKAARWLTSGRSHH